MNARVIDVALARAATVESVLTVLRVVAGAFMLPHGCTLLFGWFGGGTWQQSGALFETAFHLRPGLLWVLVAGSVELFGGATLALGFLTRLSAAAVAAVLLTAAFVMSTNGWFWHLRGAEYPLMWATLCGAFIVLGGGPRSVDGWLASRQARASRETVVGSFESSARPRFPPENTP